MPPGVIVRPAVREVPRKELRLGPPWKGHRVVPHRSGKAYQYESGGPVRGSGPGTRHAGATSRGAELVVVLFSGRLVGLVFGAASA